MNTKHDFVRRYKAGEFGNAAPTWNNLNDWLGDPVNQTRLAQSGRYHIRNRVAGGLTWYDLMWRSLYDVWINLVDKKGIDQSTLYISSMAPHHKGTIQGEFQTTAGGLYLRWASADKPMRDALSEREFHSFGIGAKALLKKYMDPSSYEWAMELLTIYPDHIVEFSSFSINWGTIPHRNTVIWEVRAY